MRVTSLPSIMLVLLCAAVATAQALPHAPSTTARAVALKLATPEVNPSPLAIQPVSPKPASKTSDEHPKVIDKKFMLLNGLVLATTAADMELTQRCQDAGTCVEMNPTIPRDRWAKHMVNVPTNAAVMYWSYRWKKQGKRLWWVPPLIDIGAHAVGLGSNIRFSW